jgi:carboxyl-terminal processing protease
VIRIAQASLGLLAIATLAAARGATDDAGSPAAPSAAESIAAPRGAETFDAVWMTVRDSHWDPALNGVDWESVRAELRPKAESAATVEEVRAVLSQALARLGQSHFGIIPGDLASGPTTPDAEHGEVAADATETNRGLRDGRCGASLAFLPGSTDRGLWETIVVGVEPGSPAETAGLEPGMRVLRIGDRDPAARLPVGDGLERHERASIAEAAASGEPGASIAWTVAASDDAEPRELTVSYRGDDRPHVKFGTLPAMPTELTWRHLDETERERWGAGDHEIGLVRFNIWLIPVARPFDVAMDTLRTADGIVIDLRGNPGGIGAMAMGIAGHFTAEPADLGEMRTRESAMRFATNPRRTTSDGKPTAPYAGPLAILVDEGTASTSEIFAGGLQHLGRAKVFGTRTAGAALPAIMTPLPNGDVFLHAIADYRLPDGTALEATGVKPDNARPYGRADYAREGDPALAEAVRWIASQPARRKTEAP